MGGQNKSGHDVLLKGKSSLHSPPLLFEAPAFRASQDDVLTSTFWIELRAFPGYDVTMANDYTLLRDYLAAQTRADFVLSFDEIEEIIDDALPRAAQRASWWDTARAPEERMPQREACIEAGYLATRMMDGKSVRFTKMKTRR